MDSHELKAWLRLALTPGVGNTTARKLLTAFGSAQAIFEQSSATLQKLGSDKLARTLRTEPPLLAAQLQTTLDWLQAGDDRRIAQQVVGPGSAPVGLLGRVGLGGDKHQARQANRLKRAGRRTDVAGMLRAHQHNAQAGGSSQGSGIRKGGIDEGRRRVHGGKW